jgi:hypothetical protein
MKKILSVVIVGILCISMFVGALTIMSAHAVTTATVTFNALNVSSAYTGTVAFVDLIAHNVSDFPLSFSWTIGDTHNFTFVSPLIVNYTYGYTWRNTTGLSTLQNDTFIVPALGGTVNATYGLIGDFGPQDVDAVGLEDLTILASAYDSTPSSGNWNPVCDLANQGVIDIVDLVTFAMHYGDHF